MKLPPLREHKIFWLGVIVLVGSIALAQIPSMTGRLTSDATLTPHGLPLPPNPSGIFVPPNTMVFTEFRTSTVPLVVEITVTSNIIRRDVFYLNGHPNTNDQMLTNWIISKITNSIP